MRRRHLGWLAGVCGLLVLVLPVTRAADWWNWRGPTQNGFSPETDLPESWSPDPKDPASNLIWSAPYGSRSTPLVMNGRVYFINYAAKKFKGANGEIRDVPETIQERVMCLDADTGKRIWEHKFNVWHTDIVTVRLGWTNLAGDPKTGNVYAHGTQGLLMCLNRDGKLLWQHSLTEEYGRITGYGGRVTSPVVDEDLVIIGMLNSAWGDLGKGGNRFVAFDKKSGEVVWWSEPAGPPKDTYYSVPVVAAIAGQRLVISGGADGGVHAMQARTGKHVWSYHFGTTAVNCSPVVDGNLVYIGQGEENPDNNVQGRVVCLDASQVADGQPRLVWKRDGLKARYTSPIIHEGKLYITDDIGKLYCLDGVKGKQLWKYDYGRDAKGSPVLADGKIYVGEVNSRFHILKPGPKRCEPLHEFYFDSPDGFTEVEINGSPAVANGRVYFSTSEETYCIGKKNAAQPKGPKQGAVQTFGFATEGQSAPIPAANPVNLVERLFGRPFEGSNPAGTKVGAAVAQLQVIPADVALHPGESVSLRVRGFDADGNLIGEQKVDEWILPTPPSPPGAKQGPPPLKGNLKDGKLTVDGKLPSQAGYVVAKIGKLTGKARVRVAPKLPYTQDFEKIADGGVPGGWVNTQGKFKVRTLKSGEKVLAKVNDKASPLIARGNAYMAEPTLHDYTIEADVMGSRAGDDLPDMGVGAHRYNLYLAGNIQKLRLSSWSALPRVDQSVDFPWQPNTWYRLKLTASVQGGKGIIKGKCWQRGQDEPSAWTIELHDAYPNEEGAPALYGYVLGIPEGGGTGTDIYYDNVRIAPNKK
jgi:outer membrane protein assembly factor BamB